MLTPELKFIDKLAKNMIKEGYIRNFQIDLPGGYSLKVGGGAYQELAKTDENPMTQIVQVISSATATSSSSVSQEIQNIIHSLEQSNVDSSKLSAAKGQLSTLESELKRPNPRKRIIKKVLRWALNFSLDLFLRLAAMVAERLIKPA